VYGHILRLVRDDIVCVRVLWDVIVGDGFVFPLHV
jgi:hypothetical protein